MLTVPNDDKDDDKDELQEIWDKKIGFKNKISEK